MFLRGLSHRFLLGRERDELEAAILSLAGCNAAACRCLVLWNRTRAAPPRSQPTTKDSLPASWAVKPRCFIACHYPSLPPSPRSPSPPYGLRLCMLLAARLSRARVSTRVTPVESPSPQASLTACLAQLPG